VARERAPAQLRRRSDCCRPHGSTGRPHYRAVRGQSVGEFTGWPDLRGDLDATQEVPTAHEIALQGVMASSGLRRVP